MTLLKLSVVFGAFCLLVGLSFEASAKPYKMSASGWSLTSQEADQDGSMSGGVVGNTAGKGSFGKFSQQSVIDTGGWDGASFCDFDPETGAPIAIPLQYLALTYITRTANGDLLYRTLSSSPASFLCFNFVEQTFTGEVYLDIIGGTGRFKGATGNATQTVSGESVGPQSAAQLREAGTINLVHSGDDD